ncbi:putative kinesin [Amanita rubescens]|nr:putative kinesin [Amanita rubescens]
MSEQIHPSQFIEINYYCADPSNIDLPPLPPIKRSSTFFTGQDEYLQKLRDHFTSNIEGQRSFFLLHGLGGIGKTQICLKFIEENPDLFSDVFWIDASSEKSVEFVLTQISSTYSTSPDGRPSARSALDWISQRPNFFMVYDGLDGHYSVVEKFLPPGNGGNVMITSRNIALKKFVLSKNSMEVHGMEDEDAISLLLKSAMLDGTDDDIYNLAQQLVSQLDGIPLAIDQAGAYMHFCGGSINGYLELYTRYKDKLMQSAPGFEGASDYGTSTYGTWDISMKKMEDIAAKDNLQESVGAQSAIKLLRIFAFLDHTNIPQELFKNAAENYVKRHIEEYVYLSSSLSLLDDETVFIGNGEWDKLKFLQGIQVLLSFSLVRSHNHLYSMHLLVNAWSRNCIPKAEVTDHFYRARALLSCSIAPDWYSDNYEFCQSLAPHIRSNILHGLGLKLNSRYYDDEHARFTFVFDRAASWDEGEQLLHVHGQFGNGILESGRWDEAEKLQMDVMNARKSKLGSDHKDTLTTMSHLASTYRNQGKWDKAEKLDMDVVNGLQMGLGSDDLSSITSMGNLASSYRNQGRWDEAERLDMNVMNALKIKLGLDHPDTLTSMANLASTYWNQGRWDEAEKLEIDVMNVSKIKLGSDHPDTLTSMANLAATYWNQGRWDEAETLQMDVMNAFKTKLGSDHPSTLTSMGNLASTYRNQGKWDEAEKLEMDVMNTFNTKLGSDHPDTLTSMANLALTYENQGRWDEAEKLEMNVMNAFKIKLGSDHPDTLTSIASLASTYWNQGRWDEAEKLQMHVMNTLTSMANLASTYRNQGRWGEAEKLEMDVMNGFKGKLGSDHPDTLASMDSLASTYWNQGRWDEAEKLQMDVMNAKKAWLRPPRHSHQHGQFGINIQESGKLGSDHPSTLSTMANLASTYSNQKRWNHPDTLTSMANLATTYRNQGRWDEAEKLDIDVMNAFNTKLGSDHPHTSPAWLIWHQHKTGKTTHHSHTWPGINIQESGKETKLGSDHPDTLAIDGLASTYWNQEDHPDTLSMANLALTYGTGKHGQFGNNILESGKLGLDHTDTLIMGGIHIQTSGKVDEAVKLQMDVMNGLKSKFGSDHPDTLNMAFWHHILVSGKVGPPSLSLMANLATTYWNQGRWDEAEKLQTDVMNALKAKLGLDHTDTLISMGNLASTYRHQGRLDEAVKLQMDVMNGFKAKLGSDHPDTLNIMGILASTYWYQGRWGEAEKLQIDVMNAYKTTLGSDHPSTLIIMANLASTYRKQERWDKAERLEMDVMSARKTKISRTHDHFKDVSHQVQEQSQDVVPMHSSSGELEHLEHIAMQPGNKFIKEFKYIWRKLKC